MVLILQYNKFLPGIRTSALIRRMPAERSKKNSEKSQPKPPEGQPAKPLTRIKFNISMDNLRPFVEPSPSSRTARKQPTFQELLPEHPRKSARTPQDRPATETALDLLRKDRRSPDVSREVSNEILQKIEANGIRFAWKEVEEVKSEFAEEEEWSSGEVWWCGYPGAQVADKNHSFASTNDHYSCYYPSMYQQLMEYAEKNRYYDPSYFLISAANLDYDQRTTLMIKNIPNKYTVQFLAEEIDREHANSYDFLYLPCDIKNNCNVGYGFINFLDTAALKVFYARFHNKRWGKFKSEKICNLTYARLQGLDSLIEHFQNSKVLNHKDKKYQPIIREFSRIDHLIKQQKSKSNNQA